MRDSEIENVLQKSKKSKSKDKKFEKLMDDNLNTPQVLRYLEILTKDSKNQPKARMIFETLGFKI